MKEQIQEQSKHFKKEIVNKVEESKVITKEPTKLLKLIIGLIIVLAISIFAVCLLVIYKLWVQGGTV